MKSALLSKTNSMKSILYFSIAYSLIALTGCQEDIEKPSKFEDKSAPFDQFYFQRSYPDNHLDMVAFDSASEKMRKSLSGNSQKNISAHGPLKDLGILEGGSIVLLFIPKTN